jgi:hypothetical protein
MYCEINTVKERILHLFFFLDSNFFNSTHLFQSVSKYRVWRGIRRLASSVDCVVHCFTLCIYSHQDLGVVISTIKTHRVMKKQFQSMD